MPVFRNIITFVASVFAIYIALLLIWPWTAGAYGGYFRATGAWLYGSFGSNGVVRFVAGDREVEGGVHENTMYLWRRDRPNAVRKISNSIRFVGYVPTAIVMALVISTPIPWLRRLRALVLALILVNMFVALRLGVVLLDVFCGDARWCLYQPGPIVRSALHITAAAFSNSPPVSYLVPVFIWIIATIRRDDLTAISAKLRADSTQS